MPAFSTDANKQPSIASGTGDPIADADALLSVARGIGENGTVEIGAFEVETSYSAALDEIVEEKQDQADRIEDQLENMIETTTARLTQVQANAPGMLALPGSKIRWQAQIAQAQVTIQLLHSRLEAVREIKEGIGVHGSRIEALAAHKLADREPQLAEDFAGMQETRRLHEIHRRQQHEKERKQGLARNASPSTGPGLSRSLSQQGG